MPQFFLAPGSAKEKTFKLEGPEAFHISKVLRYREGQTVELFDGKGGRWEGRITHLYPDGIVEGTLTATLQAARPGPAVHLNLYQGLMKASRWEWVLEKGTEIGIHSFVPIATARAVVVLHGEEHARAKSDRWSKIVLAASKQCRRAEIPEAKPAIPFLEALKECEGKGLTLFAWEKMGGSSAREALHGALASAREHKKPFQVNLFVGSEGGFTDEEVELAKFHGAHLFGMGANTLRGETAAIAAASLVLYELGVL